VYKEVYPLAMNPRANGRANAESYIAAYVGNGQLTQAEAKEVLRKLGYK
jgi:hypothetical protein